MSAGLSLVALPHDPGESADPRIVPDIRWIESTFKVRITDSYAASGHAAGGEHPLGLAADIVPDFAHGGTWDDVDRLADYAVKSGVFRFIGYDGRFGTTKWPGHGRGNHLHLSWAHTTTVVGGPGKVTTLAATGHTDSGGHVSALDFASKAGDRVLGGTLGPLTAGVDAVKDAVPDAATAAAKAGAQAALQALWDAVGENAAKALLWTALVGGGAALTVYGLIRALGMEEDAKGALRLATTAAKVAPK